MLRPRSVTLRRLFLLLGIVGVSLLSLARLQFPQPAAAAPPAQPPVDFNRQVLPILADNCFACHGPDEKQRKAKLRLDTKDGAFAKLRSGGHAIIPGKSAESVL